MNILKRSLKIIIKNSKKSRRQYFWNFEKSCKILDNHFVKKIENIRFSIFNTISNCFFSKIFSRFLRFFGNFQNIFSQLFGILDNYFFKTSLEYSWEAYIFSQKCISSPLEKVPSMMDFLLLPQLHKYDWFQKVDSEINCFALHRI